MVDHAAVVSRGLSAYLGAVERLAPVNEGQRELRLAILAMRDATTAPPDLVTLVRALRPGELAPFVNQFAPGLGSSDAPFIVVGTEAAFDLEPAKAESLILESICLPALWLAEDYMDVVCSITSSSLWRTLPPFHHEPNAYYEVHRRARPGRHTWIELASVLEIVTGIDKQELLAGVNGAGLRSLAYQVELSAHPATKSSTGTMPTAERLAFLADLVSTLPRATALLFHGKLNDLGWEACRRPIASAFLRTSTLDWQDGGDVRWSDHGGRRVISTHALSSATTLKHRARLACLLRQNSPAERDEHGIPYL